MANNSNNNNNNNNVPRLPLSPSATSLSFILWISLSIFLFPLYRLGKLWNFSPPAAVMSGCFSFINFCFIIYIIVRFEKIKAWKNSSVLGSFICFGILHLLWMVLDIDMLLRGLDTQDSALTPSKDVKSENHDMITEFTYVAMLHILQSFLNFLSAAIWAAKYYVDSKKELDAELATLYRQFASHYGQLVLQPDQALPGDIPLVPQVGRNSQQQNVVPQEPAPSYRSNRGINLAAANP